VPGCGRAVWGERCERDPWRQSAVQHGTPAAKPQGGDRRSAKIEDHAGQHFLEIPLRLGRFLPGCLMSLRP
jgi:hypothetical protein